MTVYKTHHRRMILLCLLALLTASQGLAVSADGNPSRRKSTALIVSPLFGYLKNESDNAGTDISPEYGFYVMYASPRLVINNTTFFSDVNQSDVWGNIASINLYGDPEKKLTWYLGGSYVWHRVKNDRVRVNVVEPLGKVGVVWRIPDWHLSFNPYIGYGRSDVRTEVSVVTPRGPMTFKARDRSDIAVAGVSTYWRWRMFHANVKYYMAKKFDSGQLHHNFRIWGTAMFSERMGVIARVEYEEQDTEKNTSVLFGPVFVF